ncbi:MAG: T9SS type A sorting domain-containing protein [Bacteroidales bacterium]|nr:T9SS type A sorting domain-containing protein [Bacteroidales bacterium]MCF6342523.1 T9SS type A sorting domain-containing protein [Bacteroidales bacterium]
MKKNIQLLVLLLLFFTPFIYGQGIIIDHHSAKLEPIPVWALELASDSLHIAYGHTSHGSQLISGMTELENQSTDLVGYKGDYYCWNHYQYPGEGGPCIEIHDQFRPGDLGHLGDTQWADYTRDYLDNDTVSENINVIIWSWCGGCSDNTVEGINVYLDAMNQLELDYPDIRFVYMTGHLDIWNNDTLKRNNQLIRDYCIENNKTLYDFADIESYDPDGVYYEYANDNCNYYDDSGNKLGNWAEEWQNSHEVGVDWFYCNAAHSQPLNGNLKAYASWWLWCRLVGWEGTVGITEQPTENPIPIFSYEKTIVIEANKKGRAVVFNLMGRTMLSKNVVGGKNSIPSNLPSGIYFVRVLFSDGSTSTRKLYIR